MITKITEDIYKNEITLPNTPLKVLNSYIIRSEGETLVVDTGFNLDICEQDFLNGLQELNVPLEEVHLLMTHMHSDHCGLCGRLAGKVKKMSIGDQDGHYINMLNTNAEYTWIFHDELFHKFDLTKYDICIHDDPAFSLMFQNPVDFEYLKENNVVKVGNYHFTVINTPGHTPGLISLYEPDKKVMICGDHILERISPNITFWGFEYGDMLGTYLNSLAKARDYDVKYLLGGHRSMPESMQARIDELVEHHHSRLDEIMDILQDGKQTVSTVASKMQWSIKFNGWEEFPKAQKWFASGEAMSHLEHLVALGRVVRIEEDNEPYRYEPA